MMHPGLNAQYRQHRFVIQHIDENKDGIVSALFPLYKNEAKNIPDVSSAPQFNQFQSVIMRKEVEKVAPVAW